MNDKEKVILQKIAQYLIDVTSYTQGMDFHGFAADSKTIAATAFVLGQIGELVKGISVETTGANPHIQWKGMRGLRNRIVHDYENVDLKMLWETISDDLPVLRIQIFDLLGE